MNNVPIEIHSGKLLDWVISRNICSKNWFRENEKVRGKILKATEEISDRDDLQNIVDKNFINFFDCKQILQVLSKTEGDSKNFFGRFSSQKLQDWNDIINQFQSGNIYLADSAQILMRNISFELPALKKQIDRFNKTDQDLERRERDSQSRTKEADSKFTARCRQFGIEGKSLKNEILQLARDIPAHLEQIVHQIKSNLQPAIHFYCCYAAFMQNKNLADVERAELKLCQFVISHGNATVFEWRHGFAPDQIAQSPICLSASSGGEAGENDATAEIDFDINWGDLNDEIEIEVEDEEGNEAENEKKPQKVVVEQEISRIARDEEALSILEAQSTRNLAVDDLIELRAFFTRLCEEQQMLESAGSGSNSGGSAAGNAASHGGSSGAAMLSYAIFQKAPDNVRNITLKSVRKMLEAVQSVLDLLTNKTTEHLLLVRSSEKYVDRIVESIDAFRKVASRNERATETIRSQRAENQLELDRAKHSYQLFVAQCRQLKKHIEADISQRYQNRPVHLIGEISVI